MNPTIKHPDIEDFIYATTGIDRRQTIKSNKCSICGTSVSEDSFRDDISRREYHISGMCQYCQDETFQDV